MTANETVGAGSTLTVKLRLVLPLAPEQVIVKVVSVLSGFVDWLPATGFEPLQPPEAEQLVELVELHVSVEVPPLATLAGSALSVTVGAVPTETVTLRVELPPAPLQLRLNDVVVDNGPVDSVPLVALLPVQPPDAVQLVALAALQLSVADSPLGISEGATVREILGGAETETLTLRLVLPPAPEQVSVNRVVVLNGPVDWLPLAGLAPLHPPDAEQLVALLADQLSVAAAPAATLLGLAASVSVGGEVGGAPATTVTVRLMLPPGPEQFSVKSVVAESGPVAWLPSTGLVPLQPPEAAQLVALAAAQLSVEPLPTTTTVGSASKTRVGPDAAATAMVTVWLVTPPGPEQVSEKLESAESGPTASLPETGRVPVHAPEAEQVSAFSELQFSVEA